MVVYDESTQNVNLYEVPEDQQALGVAMMVNGDESTMIKLLIDGSSLKATYNSAGRVVWFFDIDFDHQHRKNLELSEGFYYLEIPQFIDSSPDSDLHAVVRMGNSLEDGIDIVGCNGDGYVDALVYSTEDSSLDLGAWFGDRNDETFVDEIIDSLFTLLIEMEYHTTADSSIGAAKYDSITDIAVDGSFNPFTDGSPYVPPVPLRVVQRFPNGCPVTAAQIEAAGETGVPIITFNRPILNEEIGRLNAVVNEQSIVNSFMAAGNGGGLDFGLFNSEAGVLNLIQRDNTLYATSSADLMDVIDIDYDEQSKRILDFTNASTNGSQKFITMPAFGAYNLDMAVCVKLYKSSSSEIEGTYRIVANSGGDVKWWNNINGQAVYEDAENMPNDTLIAIMNAVMSMEFANVTEGPGVVTDNTSPTGPINLLTATAL